MGERLSGIEKPTDVLWRGLYGVEYRGEHWVVEVDYFDVTETITIFCDGTEVAKRKSPFKHQVAPGVWIEAAMALYGMKRARLVDEIAGSEIALTPLEGTAEDKRLRFEKRYPLTSKVVAVAAWTILFVALVTQIPNLLNSLSNLVDMMSLPVPLPKVPTLNLPDWLNCALGVMGIAAGLDRGLRMKHNPLLDD